MHFATGYTAALQAGYGFTDAVAIGYYTAAADIGTQGAEDAHKHSMTQVDKNVADAQSARDAFVRDQLGLGTLQGLGNALHAAQDEFAAGHGFQLYSGPGSVTAAHIEADVYPAQGALNAAYDRSLEMIRRFRQQACR